MSGAQKGTKQVTITLDSALVERVDAYARRMTTPTLTGRRSVAIRVLLRLALDGAGRAA